MCLEIVYLIYMYKKDLNNFQWLICYKAQPDETLVQINDLCQIELLEIELFDHLTVCKAMNDV